MNTISYFEIQADDLERAAAFYQALFGWRFSKMQELPIPYWRIETDGMRGGLLPRPFPTPHQPAGANAFVSSIQVENFDEMSAKILSLGGQLALAKFAIPGVCWQGYFVDTEGNAFGLFQPDANAK